METLLHWNGMVVTTRTPGTHIYEEGTRYRGVAFGEVWPIYDDDTEGWFIQYDAPKIIPDFSRVKRYVRLCEDQGIAVRVLLCATTSTWPLMDDDLTKRLIEKSTFLGYDYWDGNESSILHQDMMPVPPPSHELEMLARKLNKYGLFDEQADLQAYIVARDDFVRAQGWESESDPRAYLVPGEAYPTEVSELQWPLE